MWADLLVSGEILFSLAVWLFWASFFLQKVKEGNIVKLNENTWKKKELKRSPFPLKMCQTHLKWGNYFSQLPCFSFFSLQFWIVQGVMIWLFLISSNLVRREGVLEHTTKGKIGNRKRKKGKKSLASIQISVFTGHQLVFVFSASKVQNGRKVWLEV